MKKLIVTFAATMLAFSLAGIAQAEQPADSQADELSMESEALEGLFPGHYEARVAGGYRLLISAKDDGTMLGRAFGKEDKGVWVIKDQELCIAWRSWTRGEYKCGAITQNGDWFVATNSKNGETMKFKAINKRDVYAARVGRRASRD
ncbi:MAG: hypothetical protein AAGA00_13415 [Pseudomonadota bacterium]